MGAFAASLRPPGGRPPSSRGDAPASIGLVDVAGYPCTSQPLACLRPPFFSRLLVPGDEDELVYGTTAKKTIELSDDGLLSIDLKGGLNLQPSKRTVGGPGFWPLALAPPVWLLAPGFPVP